MTTGEKIFSAVSRAWEIDMQSLLSRRRHRLFVEPRMFAMFLLYERGWTLQRIGDVWGFDHSNVGHCIKRADELLKLDTNYATRADQAREILAAMPKDPAEGNRMVFQFWIGDKQHRFDGDIVTVCKRVLAFFGEATPV